jgi:hypothetical protein
MTSIKFDRVANHAERPFRFLSVIPNEVRDHALTEQREYKVIPTYYLFALD